MPAKGQTTNVLARLEAKSYDKGDCKIWNGKTVGKTNGYGEIWYFGRSVRINRLICHIYHNADLNDDSWTANHTLECLSSLCWNPDHLYVGTTQQNVQDQIKKGTFRNGAQNLNGGKNFNKEANLRARGIYKETI